MKGKKRGKGKVVAPTKVTKPKLEQEQIHFGS